MRSMRLNPLPRLDFAVAEAINTLAINVTFLGGDCTCIMMTSCGQKEGKSFIALQLAAKLAGMGHSVALVDADLRGSTFLARCGARAEGPVLGLTHHLAGHCGAEEVEYATNIRGLTVVPSGRKAINALPLLNSTALTGLIAALRARHEYVLVDAPPIGLFVDAALIARACDGTLLIVENGRASRRELRAAIAQIEKSGCAVLGVVLNKAKAEARRARRAYDPPRFAQEGNRAAGDGRGKRRKGDDRREAEDDPWLEG